MNTTPALCRVLTRVLLLILLLAGSQACRTQAQTITISNLWSISTSEARLYLTNASATSYTERGVAYNPLNNHAYIVSRAVTLRVAILHGDTGAELGFLNVSGISGGTFALSCIGVAGDGAIYAANLTTGSSTSPYKIYRWANESAAPVTVYSGNPSVAPNSNRYGESFDVRGSGEDTEIIATANVSPIVAIFKPADALLATFNSTRLDVGGLTAITDLTKGVGFGPTNSFYAKNNGATRAVHCTYTLSGGTAMVINTYTILAGIGPMDADPARGLLAGVESANATSPHNLRVYDISGGFPVLLHTSAFPAPAANNGNIVGECQIAGDRIFAIDTQNGVQMARIHVDSSLTAPIITAQPTNLTVVEGGYATLTVGATGTQPLHYQWLLDNSPITGATTNYLNLTNLALAGGSNYSVLITNVAGSTNSVAAIVTITPTAHTLVMTQCWQQVVGSRFYLAADNNSRGIAYNPQDNHLIVVSRTPTNGIHVLNADTGDYLWSMDLTGISGGTFAVNMVACTDDGQVFVGNLTTGGMTDPYKLYGFPSDGPSETSFVAWSGDPGGGVNNQRWGDNLEVRGNAGSIVEAVIGSRNGKVFAILQALSPPLGIPAQLIEAPDAPNGNFGLSIVFGTGDSVWGKATGAAIRHVSYDLNTRLGTVLRTITGHLDMAVLGYDPVENLLGGISIETPDNVRLLDLSELPDTRLVADTEFFAMDNPNGNGTGSVRIWGNKLFALDTNNGLLAMKIGRRLRQQVSNETLKLSWNGQQTLQATPTAHLPGSWTNVVSGLGPYETMLLQGASHLFYRLKD